MTAVLLAALISCGRRENPEPLPLSSDERYLVDAYLRVRRAGALFPHQRAMADSILASLAGEVDTLRVARTVAALNADPERWGVVFHTIEDRLSTRDSTGTSEPAGH